jgi:hypothetical protein
MEIGPRHGNRPRAWKSVPGMEVGIEVGAGHGNRG